MTSGIANDELQLENFAVTSASTVGNKQLEDVQFKVTSLRIENELLKG